MFDVQRGGFTRPFEGDFFFLFTVFFFLTRRGKQHNLKHVPCEQREAKALGEEERSDGPPLGRVSN
jgi:hypothetical protein